MQQRQLAGAITWADIDTGVTGIVDTANSLVGGHANDRVGDCCSINWVTDTLFVADTPDWDGGKSALTWVNTAGTLPTGRP